MRFRYLLSLLFVILTISCNRGKQNDSAATLKKLNVVLVTVDTLRPDRLGCYGYSNVETPNLDKLAQKGTLFENAIAQAPLTAPSHASIMTGLYPTAHKVRDTGGFVLAPSHITLASILQKQGWDTAAFIGASVLKRRFGFNQGFATYDDEMPKVDERKTAEVEPERRAGIVVDRAINWLQSQSGKPYFLWVHVYDPHLPYAPPSPFREKYKGRPYDGEIAYTDQQLGRLFDAIAKKSPAENTIIAVLSDHGEAFSEHGEYAHGVFLYDSTMRIAFMLAGPGVPAGTRVKQQARGMDLLPTLMGLMGGTAPQGVQGVSLTPAFRGKQVQADSYIETLYPKLNMGWAELRGIRTQRWKYVRAPKPELYDLAQDPGETKNVIDTHRAEAKELETKLKGVAGSGPEKVQTAAIDPRTMEQLKSLGYAGASSQQDIELTGQGVDPKDRADVVKTLYLAVYSGLPLPRRIAMLEQGVNEDPTNPSLYDHLGTLYMSARKPADAMKLYQQAVNKGIKSPWLYSRLGAMYYRQGNKRDAVPFLEIAAQLNPADYESLSYLAAAYRESGRIADAERVLNSIVGTGEDYAPAYNELGMAAYQKGDVAGAQKYFEKGAALDPTYQLNLGRLYRMTGDNARARQCFERFLAERGSRPEYRAMLPQVKQELASIPR